MNPGLIAVIQALDVSGLLLHLETDALRTLLAALDILRSRLAEVIENQNAAE